MKVTVTREKIYPTVGRRGPASFWSYEAFDEDGRRFDNRSVVDLRRRLREVYGSAVEIDETWKRNAR